MNQRDPSGCIPSVLLLGVVVLVVWGVAAMAEPEAGTRVLYRTDDPARCVEGRTPSLVAVYSTARQADDERAARFLDAGVLVSIDGMVLTSSVALGDRDSFEVLVGSELRQARRERLDHGEGLAALRLSGPLPADAIPLPTSLAAEARVGQSVLAVGRGPNGRVTVTSGVVSSLRPELDDDERTLLSVDAAVVTEVRGGLVLNGRCEAVGVLTGAEDDDGLGLAAGWREVAKAAQGSGL
jgi:S1-C subfamily serine protease